MQSEHAKTRLHHTSSVFDSRTRLACIVAIASAAGPAVTIAGSIMGTGTADDWRLAAGSTSFAIVTLAIATVLSRQASTHANLSAHAHDQVAHAEAMISAMQIAQNISDDLLHEVTDTIARSLLHEGEREPQPNISAESTALEKAATDTLLETLKKKLK